MFNGIGKKILVISGVAILALTIVALTVVAGKKAYRKYINPPPPHIAVIPTGSKITLPNVDWAKNKKTLLMIVQQGCGPCSKSAPFYQRLIPEAEKNNISVIAVLPNTLEESKKYLAHLNVSIKEIRLSDLDSIGVEATPSLLLVNEKGEVTKGWTGKLEEKKEAEVMKSVR